jgi:hypothetical protein
MSFLKPKYKATGSNVNNDLIKGIYTGQAEQGGAGMDYLTALLTGQGDTGAANQGYQNYLQQAGYEPALRDMSRSVVGGAAASGLLRSGSTAKALQSRGAEINQGFYNNYLNQLGSLTQAGQNAGQMLVGAGGGQVNERPRTAGMIASGIGKIAGIFSDRRLKENIVQVGTYPNGLPMYEFNYKGGEQRLRGVMSDDVRKKYPDAVVTMANGFDGVHYAMLGIRMEEVR